MHIVFIFNSRGLSAPLPLKEVKESDVCLLLFLSLVSESESVAPEGRAVGMAETGEGGVGCLSILRWGRGPLFISLHLPSLYISFLRPSAFLPFLDYHLQGEQELQPTRVSSWLLSFLEMVSLL